MSVRQTILATSALIGAVLGVPATAAASPCNPDTMAMSPQPVLSCPDQQPMPFPNSVPLGDPAYNVTGPPPSAPGIPSNGPALPQPGQAPYIPPVVNPDGSAPTFGQGGYLGEMFDEFRNGVPTDLIYGPPAPPSP